MLYWNPELSFAQEEALGRYNCEEKQMVSLVPLRAAARLYSTRYNSDTRKYFLLRRERVPSWVASRVSASG